jgi:hypothetical protein
MLDWFKRGSSPTSNAGIFELYRQLAEKARYGQLTSGPPVRLRAPRGVGAVQLLSGLHRNVSADGTVEMSESDAAPLLRAGWVRVEQRELSKQEGFALRAREPSEPSTSALASPIGLTCPIGEVGKCKTLEARH